MKYCTVDIELLLVSATGTMFYEYKVFFAGTHLTCKWCYSSIFIVNCDFSNVDYYSKSYSYQVHLRQNWWKLGKHSKVTTSVDLAGSVLLYEVSTFFGYKVTIGTVGSYATLWHILSKLHNDTKT